MKIFKLFVALAAFVLSLGAQAADTRYDFSFTADNGVSASGSFVLADGWTSSTSWQAPSSFSGSLNTNGQPTITGGTFSSFYVNNIPTNVSGSPYGVGFTVGGINYYALANKATGFGAATYAYSLDYTYTVGQSVYTVTSAIQTVNQSFTATTVTAQAVPEIDGSKIPQAALLILALVFVVRRLKAIRPTPGFSSQFA